jgi:hypothetical protein
MQETITRDVCCCFVGSSRHTACLARPPEAEPECPSWQDQERTRKWSRI